MKFCPKSDSGVILCACKKAKEKGLFKSQVFSDAPGNAKVD